MKCLLSIRRTILGGLLLLLITPAVAEDLVGCDGSVLVKFTSASPATITTVSLSGLQSGETLIGLDMRPSTGQFIGVGSNTRIYQIDSNSGVATFLNNASGVPLSGTSFGVDFATLPDERLRVVSDTGENLRLLPLPTPLW